MLMLRLPLVFTHGTIRSRRVIQTAKDEALWAGGFLNHTFLMS
jgi:hypothetical protein